METAADLRKIIRIKYFIEQIRTEYGHTASSHAFVSLYLWQKCMNLSLLCEKDFFAVKCGGDSENMWFCPCGRPGRGRTALFVKTFPISRFLYAIYATATRNFLSKDFPENGLSAMRTNPTSTYAAMKNISDISPAADFPRSEEN